VVDAAGQVCFDVVLSERSSAGPDRMGLHRPWRPGAGRVQSALLSARLTDAAAGCDIAVVTTRPASKSQQNV
jgi:hypothetical protein